MGLRDIIMIISGCSWFFLGCWRFRPIDKLDLVDFSQSVFIELWITISFLRKKRNYLSDVNTWQCILTLPLMSGRISSKSFISCCAALMGSSAACGSTTIKIESSTLHSTNGLSATPAFFYIHTTLPLPFPWVPSSTVFFNLPALRNIKLVHQSHSRNPYIKQSIL